MTDRMSVLVDYLVTKIEGQPSLLFKSVFYGDQSTITTTPIVCVGSGIKDSDLAPSKLDHEMRIYLIIYHGRVQDVQKNQREADQRAEDLIDFLHLDPQMGGNIIHGWISRSESGFAVRDRTLQAMHRLTMTAKTRTVNPFGG